MNQYVDDIQDHVRSAPWSNIRVDAFAGCGKSAFLAGLTHEVLTERERGRTGYTAFQRDVVDLMRPKIADGVSCMTIHGAGLGALMQAYPRSEVYQSKYHYIIKDRIEEYQIKEWKLRAEWTNATKKLLEKVMVEVVREPNEEVLMEIADHYSIDLPYDSGEAVDLIDHCLDLGRTQLKRRIAFVDMIYWPIVDNLPMKETCETLLVDEAQDFSEAHWQMVKKLADGRIIYAGDDLQTIFGFSGSKTGGMATMAEELKAVSFPLPICYRCPISHVKLAQWHAKGMQWRPDAPEGTIKYLNRIEDLFGPRWKWEPGQVTLCRTRRPLIELAHKLVQQRIPVAVKGSALDDGLLSLLDRVSGRKGVRWSTLQWDIEDYRDEKVGQMERRESDQMAIDEFKDKCDSLSTLTRMAKELLVDDIKGLENFIKDLFEKDPKEKVILATFHTFKGAEADTVIRIRPDLIPHPKAKKAWEQVQERNLDYIGNTRSKDTLVFVKQDKHYLEAAL